MSNSKNSIKLSKKHGVNPTIPVCFFCGEPKNELALLGKIGGRGEDPQAPMYSLLDYAPCETCAESMAQGVTMVECSKGQTGYPMIDSDRQIYPTGRWVVLTHEAAQRIFDLPEDTNRAFVEVGVLDQLGAFDDQDQDNKQEE